MRENGEIDTIVAIQAFLGTEPHESLAVLDDCIDERLRKTLVAPQVLKSYAPGIGGAYQARQCQQKNNRSVRADARYRTRHAT